MIKENIISSLIKSKLFKGLDESQIGEVLSFVAVIEREYSKNQVIINQGEPVSKIGVLEKGIAISTKYHIDGNAQILRIYNQGEIISLDAINTSLRTSPSTLTSQTDSKIFFIPYLKMIESDSIGANVKQTIMTNCSKILSNELIRLTYKIDVLSKRTLQERVMTHLSLMKERTGKDIFDIGMNQEQFAQYLCVNRSVLSKELNKMRTAGLIDYKRNRYKIFFDME